MPQHLFGTAGFAYIGAMVCSIEALKYVNFPTKELGKSCKVGGGDWKVSRSGMVKWNGAWQLHKGVLQGGTG